MGGGGGGGGGVPHSKDWSMLGSILGFPCFGKLPLCTLHWDTLIVDHNKGSRNLDLRQSSCCRYGLQSPFEKSDQAGYI